MDDGFACFRILLQFFYMWTNKINFKKPQTFWSPQLSMKCECYTCLYVTGDCLHLWSDCDHPDDHGLSLDWLAHGCWMEAGAVHTLYSRWCPSATAFQRAGSSGLLSGKRRGYVLLMLPCALVSCSFVLGAFTKLWKASHVCPSVSGLPGLPSCV